MAIGEDSNVYEYTNSKFVLFKRKDGTPLKVLDISLESKNVMWYLTLRNAPCRINLQTKDVRCVRGWFRNISAKNNVAVGVGDSYVTQSSLKCTNIICS